MEDRRLSTCAGWASEAVFAPEGRSVAFVEERGSARRIVIDETPGEWFDEVRTPFFSADGSLCSYGARRDSTWTVVTNGRPGEALEELGLLGLDSAEREVYYFAKISGFVFCVGGGERRQAQGRFASARSYPAYSDDLKVYVRGADARGIPRFGTFEGQGCAEFEEIGLLSSSPDESRLAFTAKKGGRWYVVLDGKRRGAYDGVAGLRWTPDGRELTYAVRQGWKWRLVIGDQSGPEFDEVVGPYWSRDGKRVAYEGRAGSRWSFVLDGRVGAAFDWTMHGSLLFSPDGTSCAYLAGQRDRTFAVVDGRRGAGSDAIRSLTYSPDGKQVAYVALRGKRQAFVLGNDVLAEADQVSLLGLEEGPRYVTVERGAHYYVRGDRKEGPFEEIRVEGEYPRGPILPLARKNREWLVMEGEPPGPGYDEISRVTYLRGRDAFAFCGRRGERSRLVVGGREEPTYDAIGQVLPSSDGSQVAYAARSGEEWFPVIRGERMGNSCDRIWELRFSPDGRRLHWGAQCGSELWWKTARIG